MLLIKRFSLLIILAIAAVIAIQYFDGFTIYEAFKQEYGAIAGVGEVIAVWIVAWVVVKYFSDIFKKIDDVVDEVDFSEHTHSVIKKIFKYAVYILALLTTLNLLGLTGAIEGLLVGAGFAGIVVGFAAKDILSNLIGGLSILADRPFKIGDWIKLTDKNLSGSVKEISLRSTEIVSSDNTVINLPNSLVANTPIINYSKNKLRKIIFPVSIAYEADFKKATKVIKDELKGDEAIVSNKDIEVLFSNFGPSSVDLTVRVWVDTKKGKGAVETQSRLKNEVKIALDKAGIEIPYPKQVMIQKKE